MGQVERGGGREEKRIFLDNQGERGDTPEKEGGALESFIGGLSGTWSRDEMTRITNEEDTQSSKARC